MEVRLRSDRLGCLSWPRRRGILLIAHIRDIQEYAGSRQLDRLRWTIPYSSRMAQRVIYKAEYHRQHCTLQTIEQFRAMYMPNHDGKHLVRSGIEPVDLLPGYKP